MQVSTSNKNAVGNVLRIAIDWVRRTGWPTRAADRTIASRIYDQWLTASNADSTETQQHDVELLHDMLGSALSKLHTPEGVECLQIILVLELVIHGREDGVIKRHRPH